MRRAVRQAFARPIAHRGLHAPCGPVENTLAAAAAAVAAGFGVECDVRLSRDGRAVVVHDERLERLAGLDVAVADCDAAALGRVRLADGSAVPSLRELLALVAGRAALIVEIKATGDAACDERLVEAVLEDVGDGLGAVLLESFEPAIVRRCADADCPVGLVGPLRGTDSLDAAASLPRCDFLSWSLEALAEAAARHPRLPLSAWTVRTPAQRGAAEALGAQIVFEGFDP